MLDPLLRHEKELAQSRTEPVVPCVSERSIADGHILEQLERGLVDFLQREKPGPDDVRPA